MYIQVCKGDVLYHSKTVDMVVFRSSLRKLFHSTPFVGSSPFFDTVMNCCFLVASTLYVYCLKKVLMYENSALLYNV